MKMPSISTLNRTGSTNDDLMEVSGIGSHISASTRLWKR